MLSAQDAQRKLAGIARSDWSSAREQALRRLPGSSPQIALTVIDHRYRRPNEALLVGIDRMKPRRRRKLFDALAPGLGEAVERGWMHQLDAPYQHALTRRPFRAPNNPDLGIERRTWWLAGISDLVWEYGRTDLDWYAAWAPYLSGGGRALGRLLAAEIDGGARGDAVYETLAASARGDHPIGGMGRHVVEALLASSRPDGWELMERMLVAAQRQEGLRQVIVETVDEAHPEAFRRMIRLIVEERLTRFASVVRGFDVWFGTAFDVTQRATVDALLTAAARCLDDPKAQAEALSSADAGTSYAALWTVALGDVAKVAAPAVSMMADPEPGRRFAATHLVAQLRLPQFDALLLERLQDPDDRVAWRALTGLHGRGRPLREPAFDRLERYLERVPKKQSLEPLLWEWAEATTDPDVVLELMLRQVETTDPLRLAAHTGRMGAGVRGRYARAVAQAEESTERRAVLLELTSDRSQWVRQTVFEALASTRITEAEAPGLEALLTRKTASVRRSTIGLLLNQTDGGALASAERLLASSSKLQREAGFDLLREMIAAERSPEAARALVDNHAEARPLTEQEQQLVEAISAEGAAVPTLDDCLGLIDPAARTPPPEMTNRFPALADDTLERVIGAADDFVSRNRDLPLRHENVAGRELQLYGDMRWVRMADAVTEDGSPLTDLWHEWWRDEGRRLTGDALTLSRAVAALTPRRGPEDRERWEREVMRLLPTAPEPEYASQVARGIHWMWLTELDGESIGFLLDAAETTLASIPGSVRAQGLTERRFANWSQPGWDWRSSPALAWVDVARSAFGARPESWSRDELARLWGILRWVDEPSATAPRRRPGLAEAIAAYRAGLATDIDMVDHFVGPRIRRGYYGAGLFHDLGQATRRRPPDLISKSPGITELVKLIVDRTLEVELARGEMPTAASVPALSLRSVVGAERMIQLASALGRRSLTRGWTWDAEATHSVLSHLIRVSIPAETDTPAGFAELAAAAKTGESRLLDIAVYAPQWARYVEHALDWPGLEDAVHWVHAHTKGSNWRVGADIRELWAAEVAASTPLLPEELTDGAVDVSWYRRSHAALGEERWQRLDKAAKYASGGGGHKRAQLFAAALSGSVSEDELRRRIDEKRHQDSVRALGLLPLPSGDDQRSATVLERYEAVQEFRRGSKSFGAQRRESERKAADIALANLARTAGYPDPQRLQWAMETAAVADLNDGGIAVTRGEYEVTLSVDGDGKPHLATTKNGGPLKSVPAKLRKDPDIAALRRRKTQLNRQASRMRASLEQAAIRGDRFATAELAALYEHPILRPMIERLVWVDPEGLLGYLDASTRALRSPDGSTTAVGGQLLRIAHPHDLLLSDRWADYQHECFVAERIQPFKQVFRELYVLTEAERTDGALSRRYAGHQVNPRQATALLGTRGWIAHPEDGLSKTYHDAWLTAHVGMVGGWYSPAEVDGMTIEIVYFTKRNEWEAIPLEEVPSRLFSEAMRDVDLAVSVAHIGGVDPEASASTVEMRRALVAETASILRIDNVDFAGSSVVISGSLGDYSVHLGSGLVHQRPGGAICIIPVGSQHRGRLFLPFADDDPKTAEVVSKVVMLARDQDIKDPTILEQLVR